MRKAWFKKLAASLCICLALVRPTPAKADMFGGDIAVLLQILSNALQQLQQLQQIVGTAQDNIALIREINRGINETLGLIRTVSPYTDPGIYSDWNGVQGALQGLQNVYGSVVPSKISTMQEHTDRNVAEAVTLNNAIYSYTRDIDEIGESIKQHSRNASPGGAQKLTAESLGVMLNVMNQNLRAHATGLKLQAQALAVQNQKDKEYVRHLVDSSQRLSAALKAQDTQFKMPRF